MKNKKSKKIIKKTKDGIEYWFGNTKKGEIIFGNKDADLIIPVNKSQTNPLKIHNTNKTTHLAITWK